MVNEWAGSGADFAFGDDRPGSTLSPAEILSYQSREGLFDDAFATGSSLGADMTSVFEILAAKCARVATAQSSQ